MLDAELIEKTLKNGIVLLDNNQEITFCTLSYVVQTNSYIICYQYDDSAGFVYYLDHNKTWKIRGE